MVENNLPVNLSTETNIKISRHHLDQVETGRHLVEAVVKAVDLLLSLDRHDLLEPSDSFLDALVDLVAPVAPESCHLGGQLGLLALESDRVVGQLGLLGQESLHPDGQVGLVDPESDHVAGRTGLSGPESHRLFGRAALLGLESDHVAGQVGHSGLESHHQLGRVALSGPESHLVVGQVGLSGLESHHQLGQAALSGLESHHHLGRVALLGQESHLVVGQVGLSGQESHRLFGQVGLSGLESCHLAGQAGPLDQENYRLGLVAQEKHHLEGALDCRQQAIAGLVLVTAALPATLLHASRHLQNSHHTMYRHKLAHETSNQLYTVPEAALPVSQKAVKSAVGDRVYKQAHARWENHSN